MVRECAVTVLVFVMLSGLGASLGRAALAQPHAGEPPVTTVVGADGLWHNHDVRLTFLALDDSGSVAGIQIRVDNGTMIDVPAAKYQMTLAAPADHSGDGRHLVEFRAYDADGNVEEWKTRP